MRMVELALAAPGRLQRGQLKKKKKLIKSIPFPVEADVRKVWNSLVFSGYCTGRQTCGRCLLYCCARRVHRKPPGWQRTESLRPTWSARAATMILTTRTTSNIALTKVIFVQISSTKDLEKSAGIRRISYRTYEYQSVTGVRVV